MASDVWNILWLLILIGTAQAGDDKKKESLWKVGGASFDFRDVNDTYLALLGITLVLLTAMLAVFIRNHILEMLLENLGCIPRPPPPKQKAQHPSGGKRPRVPGDSTTTHKAPRRRGSDTPYIPLRQIASSPEYKRRRSFLEERPLLGRDSDDGGSPVRGIPSETPKQKERRLPPPWNSGGNDTKKKNNNACCSQLPQDVKKRDDKKKNNNNGNFDKRKRDERQPQHPRGLEKFARV